MLATLGLLLLALYAAPVLACGEALNLTYSNGLVYTFGAKRGTSATLPMPIDVGLVKRVTISYVSGYVASDFDYPDIRSMWGCGSLGGTYSASLTLTDDNTTNPLVLLEDLCGDSANPGGNTTPLVFWFDNVRWTTGRKLKVWYTDDWLNTTAVENNLGETQFTYTVLYDQKHCPICSDANVTNNEECDSVKWCDEKFCVCLDGSKPTKGKNYCDCPNLTNVDVTVVKEPPTFASVITGVNDTSAVSISIRLPQMHPHRWNATAIFVHPVTHEASNVTVPLTEHPCYWDANVTFTLLDLIRFAKPTVTNTSDYYYYTFNVLVSVSENITTSVRRPEWIFNFTIGVRHSSSIQVPIVSDSTVLWAYISKSSVHVPTDGSNPSVDLQIITSAVQSGFKIDPVTFLAIKGGVTGHVVSVTDPEFLADKQYYMQQWEITATLQSGSVCSTSSADTFSLKYTIYDFAGKSNARNSSSLTASLSGLENWCTDSVSIKYDAVQTLYTSKGEKTSESYLKFFLNDMIYVRVHVLSSLNITEVDITSVIVGSSKSATSVNIMSNATFKYGLDKCPSGSNDVTWVCYHFKLIDSLFTTGDQLTISTSLSVEIGGVKSRRSTSSVHVVRTQTVALISTDLSAASPVAPLTTLFLSSLAILLALL